MIRMLICLPIIVAILVFAFVNNDLVTFSLWPLDIDVTSSFSVVVVALVVIGFILGRVSAWFSYIPVRRELSSYKKENKKLSKEHQKAKEEVEELKDGIDSLKNKETKIVDTYEDKSLKATFKKLFKSPEK